jgi:hypothetical protein
MHCRRCQKASMSLTVSGVQSCALVNTFFLSRLNSHLITCFSLFTTAHSRLLLAFTALGVRSISDLQRLLADPLELADFVADLALAHAYEDRTVAAEAESLRAARAAIAREQNVLRPLAEECARLEAAERAQRAELAALIQRQVWRWRWSLTAL